MKHQHTHTPDDVKRLLLFPVVHGRWSCFTVVVVMCDGCRAEDAPVTTEAQARRRCTVSYPHASITVAGLRQHTGAR